MFKQQFFLYSLFATTHTSPVIIFYATSESLFIHCLVSLCVVFQRAAHVYSEAKRVHAFKDTVSSDLRCSLNLLH